MLLCTFLSKKGNIFLLSWASNNVFDAMASLYVVGIRRYQRKLQVKLVNDYRAWKAQRSKQPSSWWPSTLTRLLQEAAAENERKRIVAPRFSSIPPSVEVGIVRVFMRKGFKEWPSSISSSNVTMAIMNFCSSSSYSPFQRERERESNDTTLVMTSQLLTQWERERECRWSLYFLKLSSFHLEFFSLQPAHSIRMNLSSSRPSISLLLTLTRSRLRLRRRRWRWSWRWLARSR